MTRYYDEEECSCPRCRISDEGLLKELVIKLGLPWVTEQASKVQEEVDKAARARLEEQKQLRISYLRELISCGTRAQEELDDLLKDAVD